MIMRLYDPSNKEGEVLIDGHNIKDLDLTWYHQKAIAIVSQNPQMFEGQVDYNIGYGLDECENTPEAYKERLRLVRESAKLAAADGFIMNVSKFPDHYQTLVGEKGVKLSGG
jgi:ABC-type multidrug transport system fused ATPase/permease subunit